MYKTVVIAVLLVLTGCAGKTECRLDPGVDLKVTSTETIPKTADIEFNPKANLSCNF
tara:strand:- start:735 stop:905 length:171 start_codon:yes stop_codon:yes gene_type:complete